MKDVGLSGEGYQPLPEEHKPETEEGEKRNLGNGVKKERRNIGRNNVRGRL